MKLWNGSSIADGEWETALAYWVECRLRNQEITVAGLMAVLSAPAGRAVNILSTLADLDLGTAERLWTEDLYIEPMG